MIPALCILLPFLFAAASSWVPAGRAVSLGVAGVDLLLALSLPWTGTALGGWLLPDPLAVHVLVLVGFGWCMASVMEASPPALAVAIGLLNLALLSDSAGLTAFAAGGAGVCAVLCLQPPTGSLLRLAALGLGLAVFGTVLLYAGTAPVLGLGWDGLRWSGLPQAGAANGIALGAGFALMLLGLGVASLAVPVGAALGTVALPRSLAIVAGPLGATWLVVALRMRGVLNGNGHAIPPGGTLLVLGFAVMALAGFCLRRPANGVAAALLSVFAAVLIGFGVDGAAATGAALLHLTLGCLALTAAATGSRLGLAALAGLPPLGVFASGFALVAAAAGRSLALAACLALGLFGVALLVLRAPPLPETGSRWAWVGIGLALIGAWAMPPPITAWIQGIAAAAR